MTVLGVIPFEFYVAVLRVDQIQRTIYFACRGLADLYGSLPRVLPTG